MADFWMPALGLVVFCVFQYFLFFSRRAGRSTFQALLCWELLAVALVAGLFLPITQFVENDSGVGVYQVVDDKKLGDFATINASGGQIATFV